MIAERYANKIAEYQCSCHGRAITGVYRRGSEYEAEVIKVIRGESKLNPDMLNKLHEDAKAKAADAEQNVKRLEAQLRR